MENTERKIIKTGGDPRRLPDFIALREEISKLTHPARPDVNWTRVEQLAVTLFTNNGVELQTASWYTLARSELVLLDGMIEGLTVVNTLIHYKWEELWPKPIHARSEIIHYLFQRLQKVFRTFSLELHDLNKLQQAKNQLNLLKPLLEKYEITQFNAIDNLHQQIQNEIERLEKLSPNVGNSADPIEVLTTTEKSSNKPVESTQKLVYVVHQESDKFVESRAPQKSWTMFFAGMATMLVIALIFILWLVKALDDKAF